MSDAPLVQNVPPHSAEAEMAVLGSVLLDARAVDHVSEILLPEHFYLESHAKIYRAVLDLSASSSPIDVLTLKDRLAKQGSLEQVGGMEYLAELAARVPSSVNARAYATLVREKSILRAMIQAGQFIVGEGFNEPESVEAFIDESEKRLFDIAQQKIEQPYVPIKSLVNAAIKRIETLEAMENAVSGVPSDFTALDKLTSGFQPGELIIMAGRPSMGKTSLALNIAQNAALNHGKAVGFFSLEMSRIEVAVRMLCSLAKVDSQKYRGGRIDDKEWIRLIDAAGKLSKTAVLIDDSAGLREMEVRAKARRMKQQHDVSVIFVDYLQLMRATGMPRNAPREQEISQISRSLKALAKELQIPVVALSQLNRDLEKRGDKRPQMSDLRESGAIEQDADVILFIYRDVVYHPEAADKETEAEVIVAKQRNGPTGVAVLRYEKQFTLFENMISDDAAMSYIRPLHSPRFDTGENGDLDAPPPDDDDDIGY